ncbi:MAG: hypothetical protein WCS37_10615 [Chloroflexota bacterium]|nr:hypothetical protein [Chloroflexota bacterium]
MSDRWNRDPFRIGLLELGKCHDETAKLAISSYLDGEADSEERALAEYHLPSCLACQNMALTWRQEAHLVGSTRFSDSATYQIQAEVRASLQPFWLKEATKTQRHSAPSSSLALAGGMTALLAVVVCGLLLARLSFNGAAILDSSTAFTMVAGSAATAHATNSTVIFSQLNNLLPATPTVTTSPLLGESLSPDLKEATSFRYYPALTGRFAGLTALVAWYSDKNNRIWIIDPLQGNREISLAALAEQDEAVRFHYNDPQAVIWSERGAIVSYHLSDNKVNELGLVIPQAGEFSVVRLVQPSTVAALARATSSPVAHQ